jgi:hypothetical protein
MKERDPNFHDPGLDSKPAINPPISGLWCSHPQTGASSQKLTVKTSCSFDPSGPIATRTLVASPSPRGDHSTRP